MQEEVGVGSVRLLDLNIWNDSEPWHARRQEIIRVVLET